MSQATSCLSLYEASHPQVRKLIEARKLEYKDSMGIRFRFMIMVGTPV